LEQDARGRERDLPGCASRCPAPESLDVVAGDHHPVLGPEQILQENPERVRQSVNLDAGSGQRVEPKDLEGPVTDLQG
jgi:hypothetical protein